ncbi:MAG TPA: mannosyltransferase family protein [Caldilineaceae bacterium]|nr:mannosyltransferase family protein [Caldilineaceae bacterium]
MTALTPAPSLAQRAYTILTLNPWLWRHILLPLLATRMALLATGWLAREFPIWPLYPVMVVHERGWLFSPYRLLDIWGRWDSSWYMDIALNGYSLLGDLDTVQSNVAFFPLFPYLVRAMLWFVPDRMQTGGVALLAGLLINNTLLVAALILLHRLVMEYYDDLALAQRTVLYILLYPMAFFFSAFYSESSFFFFAIATFYAAKRRAWGWAAASAALLGATRPLGVLIVAPLAWMMVEAAGGRLRGLGREVLWLLITPLGLFAHLTHMYLLTGDFLAPMRVQQAFFRGAATPWQTLLHPVNAGILMTQLEQALTVLFLVGGVYACFRLPSAAYGLYTLSLVLPPLFTGTLTAVARYYMVAFPVFILLAASGRHPVIDRLLQTLFFAIQIVIMVAWSQFHFVA